MRVYCTGEHNNSAVMEREINKFIEDKDVVDIKYSAVVDVQADYPQMIFSALIMYQDGR